ncbi:hypothetical protein [Paraburkholderia domus]|jgi:hypothetical protein|uniref:hypothetical protein n=1 Tax=Paraburkholderia domus TaxID=2793075 RepID=UPI0019128DE2|nr:hypothetical protein [Paraburkholderia domus]MBK5052657.1 hypothetical protein [Burkholderia sp. R-70006]MBK5064699.1 hypothetical protein [Burkholderia sp. R-70199]MBK5089543.1 hypothetical protein [Burkholderia sp. R-69927]MBK5124544.1 hypothetical protein [Burkholderia sp. R-69980]MBK5168677.1 hypothetical protein [Burkholderia sp. R-70211]MBK5183985.1 hypothetical protein [Burkholderia sp. R-69749]MCI0149897.1 hypothetical protein [Paraburkholderia sediminicola]
MEGPWGGWRKTGSGCEAGFEALLLPLCIASILDACPARQFTNSDAFFAFSAMSVLFRQVAMTVLERSLAFRAFAALQLIVVRSSGAYPRAGSSVLVPDV